MNRYTKRAWWDFAKLQYFVCKYRMDGFKCYDKSVFVILKSDSAEYILPKSFPKYKKWQNALVRSNER